MKLSIIIPCYNEEKNISLFMDACIKTFDDSIKIEYIFVNDGSKDQTWESIKSIHKKYSKYEIVGINFSRNFGKEAAMLAGLEKSTGDYVVIIDADLQQHPKYIQKMLDFLLKNEDYDCVACYPEKRIGKKGVNLLSNLFYKIINKISDVPFYKNVSDFRLMKREVVNAIIDMQEYYRFSKGIFSFVGFQTYYMSYKMDERKYGKSSWPLRKCIPYALGGIIDFSFAPLRIVMFTGSITFLVSIIYLIVKVIEMITAGTNIDAYSIIIFFILFFSGLQMIFLGIIGEYLGRTYMESKKRPIYIIKDKIDNHHDKDLS